MPVDIEATVEENKIIVFVILSGQYSKQLQNITKTLVGLKKGICYVSLNKPYKVVQANLNKARIPTENMYFVDAVSSKAGSVEPDKKVVFVSSPQALTELSIAINKCLGPWKLDTVLFDSLSTLLVYEEASSTVKFVHSVISTLRVKEKSCIFTILKEDLQEELVKDLGMFADKIEELK